MADPLPLRATSERLRGKPGRPRKSSSTPTAGSQVKNNLAEKLPPRLLNIHEAASYLGISSWSLRDLINAGTVLRVRVPMGANGEMRKVLLDREDLDRLIEQWKDAPQ